MSQSSIAGDDRDYNDVMVEQHSSSGSVDRHKKKKASSRRSRGTGRRKHRQIHAASFDDSDALTFQFQPASLKFDPRRHRSSLRSSHSSSLTSSTTSSTSLRSSLHSSSLRSSTGAASYRSHLPDAENDVEDDASSASPEISCATAATERLSNTTMRMYKELYEAALEEAIRGGADRSGSSGATGLEEIREESGAAVTEKKTSAKRVVNKSFRGRGSSSSGGTGNSRVVPFALAMESYIDGLQVQEVQVEEVSVVSPAHEAEAGSLVIFEEEGTDFAAEEDDEDDGDSIHLSASDESSSDEDAPVPSGANKGNRGGRSDDDDEEAVVSGGSRKIDATLAPTRMSRQDTMIAPTRKSKQNRKQPLDRSARSNVGKRSERDDGCARDLRDQVWKLNRNSIMVTNLSELQATPRKKSSTSTNCGSDLQPTSRRKSGAVTRVGDRSSSKAPAASRSDPEKKHRRRPQSSAVSPAAAKERRSRSGHRERSPSRNRDRSRSTVGSHRSGSVASHMSRGSHQSGYGDQSDSGDCGGRAASRSLSRLRRAFSTSSHSEDDDGASLLSEERHAKDGRSPAVSSYDHGARPKKGLLRKVKKLAGKVKNTLEEIGDSLSGLHHYKVGERARYKVAKLPRYNLDLYDPETRTVEVVIVEVKIDAVLETPYYAIRLPDGRVKQTAWDNLMTLVDYRKITAVGDDVFDERERSPSRGGRHRASSRGPSGGASSSSRSRRSSRSRSPSASRGDDGDRPAAAPRHTPRSAPRSASRTAPRSEAVASRRPSSSRGRDHGDRPRSQGPQSSPGEEARRRRRSGVRGAARPRSSSSRRSPSPAAARPKHVGSTRRPRR